MLNKLTDNSQQRLVNQILFFTEKTQYQQKDFCSVDGKNRFHAEE